MGRPTGALPAIKPEATVIGIIARWWLENSLNVWWAQVVHTESYVFYVTADDTSLAISDVLLRRNQSQRRLIMEGEGWGKRGIGPPTLWLLPPPVLDIYLFYVYGWAYLRTWRSRAACAGA